MAKVKQRKMDMDKARAKHEEIESRSAGIRHEIKHGWNTFFILPPWDDKLEIWKEVEKHGLHVCPKRAGVRECLMCSEIRKRAKRGDTDFVEANQLKPQAFFNALRKTDVKKKDPDCVKVLRVSPKIFGEIVEHVNDEGVDISNPAEAVPVMLKKKGSGMQTRYKLKMGEPVDISAYITDKILANLHDLDTIRDTQPATDKDLRKEIRGAADDDLDDDGGDDFDDDLADDDDNEEEKPTRKKSKKGKKEAAELDGEEEDAGADDDDDLVDDEDEGSDDNGEEEEEEEDDIFSDDDLGLDEDDEEEEEEPPPPPKKAKKSGTSKKGKKAKKRSK